MTKRLVAVVLFSVLTACGSGSGMSSSGGASPSTPMTPAQPQGTVKTSFVIAVPRGTAAETTGAVRHPSYVSPGTLSVTIVLNTVNGSAPAAGLTTSALSNLTAGDCTAGCTVAGPSVPPGTDNFTISTFSAANGGGSVLSTVTQSFTVNEGVVNNLSATLAGVPSSFTISGVPSGTAGTAFGTSATLSVAVKDATGNTITGGYSTPVTLSDSDTSSLTQGTSLTVNSGTAAVSVTLNASTDVAKLGYGGLAIVPATLTASASGATSGTATFTPTLQPIVLTPTQVNLFALTGTGSTGTSTAAEIGWSNSPYNHVFSVSAPAGCSTIATVSGNTTSTTGTTFTANVVATPAAGSCVATIADGVNQTAGLTVTFTSTNFNVNSVGKHSR